MAPKKRKPQNLARGFATTSIPSKSKTQPIDETSKNDSNPEAQTTSPSDSGVKTPEWMGNQNPESNWNAPDLQQMTPEDLEQYLEDGEQQEFVVQYSAKVHRESARCVNKLQTDYRLLRGHAQNLNCRYMLPQSTVSQILRLAREVSPIC